MDSFINHIEIKNFKSIRHLEIDGLKKINLFIGKPNVGKSNILEALSLFTLPLFENDLSIALDDLIRVENLQDFFYQSNVSENCVVKINDAKTFYISSIRYIDNIDEIFEGREKNLNNEKWDALSFESSFSSDNASLGKINNFRIAFDHTFKQLFSGGKGEIISLIKTYLFKKGFLGKAIRTSYLFPPFGVNLSYILQFKPKLRAEIANWFDPFGLKLVLDRTSNSVKIQKDVGINQIFTVPYSSIADTLQRLIFYKTAIISNKNSVLIFEEPEAHAYPPYIAEFTQEVINSETNQFFMATHSPIIVNDFLENSIDDLAIFIVDYKDDQTKVKPLSREEIHDVYKYGIDLFFNNEAYPV